MPMRSQKRAASEPLGTTHVPVSQPRGTSCRGGPGPGHCVQGGLWESAGRDPSRPCDSSSGSAVSPRTAGTEAAAGERSAPSALGSRERGHLLLFPSTSSPKRPSTRREGRAETGLPQTAPQTPGGSVSRAARGGGGQAKCRTGLRRPRGCFQRWEVRLTFRAEKQGGLIRSGWGSGE